MNKRFNSDENGNTLQGQITIPRGKVFKCPSCGKAHICKSRNDYKDFGFLTCSCGEFIKIPDKIFRLFMLTGRTIEHLCPTCNCIWSWEESTHDYHDYDFISLCVGCGWVVFKKWLRTLFE